MMQLKEIWDGTENVPRQVQETALNFVDDVWDSSNIIALQMPVGAGKSAVARSIQRKYAGTAILTPTNVLVDQYVKTYKINYLKGITHYKCKSFPSNNVSCSYKIQVQKVSPCAGCPFIECKTKARRADQPTVFNLLSYFYASKGAGWENRKTVVIDEAHMILSTVKEFTTRSFSKKKYQYPSNWADDATLAKWFETLALELEQGLDRVEDSIRPETLQKKKLFARSMRILAENFNEDPQHYAVWEDYDKQTDNMVLKIQPIYVPKSAIRSYIGGKDVKKVLLSGTLFKKDANNLAWFDDKVSYLDLPSPIPAEQRPILYRPSDVKFNYQTNPQDIADRIQAVLDEFPGRNTLVHLPYRLAEEIAPLMKTKVIVHKAANKEWALRFFKERGGILFACGMAEGIDLPDNLCRLVIVPKILYPPIMHPYWKKALALPGGQKMYDLTVIKTLIQQFGRGCRHEKDEVINVILDPTFSGLIARNSKDLSNSFKESIKWSGAL